MPRLFVAIDIPDAVKDQLARMMTGVPGAKWVRRGQLHLTLKFIGEVDAARFEAVKAGLAGVQARRFALTLRGTGCFPPRGKPRVLWVGVDAPPALNALYREVETALTALGVAPDDRPFSAHITLARLKEAPPRESTERFLQTHASFATESIPVRAFALYSSILAPQGSTYHVEQNYALSE